MVASRRAYDLVHVVEKKRWRPALSPIATALEGTRTGRTLHVEYNPHMWEATVSENKPTDESQ
jgi:hypothetical protein